MIVPGTTSLITADKLAVAQQMTAGVRTRGMTAVATADATMTIGAAMIAEPSVKLTLMTEGIMTEAMITIGITTAAITKKK